MILHDESSIVNVIRDRQAAMRREMDRRQIAMKVVSQDSGIAYATLLTYFPADGAKQPAQIPGSAIYALTGHIPADILSLLLPVGHVIVQVPEEINHDQMADAMAEYLAECEDNVLRGKFAKVKAA
jgi:hypothetical protein